MKEDEIKKAVKEKYAEIAVSSTKGCGCSCNCSGAKAAISTGAGANASAAASASASASGNARASAVAFAGSGSGAAAGAFASAGSGQGVAAGAVAGVGSGQGVAAGVVAGAGSGQIAAAIKISKDIGYTEEEMASVPEGANLALGCGNPVAHALLREGEVVLDLGSGAGFDCFLAAGRVGKKGRVIGVDMTPEMIARAKENALKGGYENVEFRQGEIENLPVEDNHVDTVISNCVINLSPDKKKVFSELYRVLKPGAHFVVSDIVFTKPVPDSVRDNVTAYVSCIAGAMVREDYLDAIKEAGFKDIRILGEQDFPVDLMVSDPVAEALRKDSSLSPEELKKLSESIVSMKIQGFKPLDL
ncbi:MAG: arsenite methyltransferase [Candidatus Xenobiia bacterium LiM19]